VDSFPTYANHQIHTRLQHSLIQVLRLRVSLSPCPLIISTCALLAFS